MQTTHTYLSFEFLKMMKRYISDYDINQAYRLKIIFAALIIRAFSHLITKQNGSIFCFAHLKIQAFEHF